MRQGRADDERAMLDVTVRVQLLADEKWIRVPLKLSEGILRGVEHDGPGDAQFEGIEREAGYRCWFRGKGDLPPAGGTGAGNVAGHFTFEVVGLEVEESLRLIADQVTGGTIADSGHFIPEEQPEALVARLLDFWER